jgi:hypothetical protein
MGRSRHLSGSTRARSGASPRCRARPCVPHCTRRSSSRSDLHACAPTGVSLSCGGRGGLRQWSKRAKEGYIYALDTRLTLAMFGRALVAGLAVASSGCAALGFTDQVLLRLPSPDGRMLAVCQEVPAFDGPNYSIRLERPDGTVLRRLYEIGDGDPCSEMSWSPDGRALAVLSGHVARIRFVDVAWALEHPATTTANWSWRQVDFGSEQQPLNAAGLRFVGPRQVELQLCPPQWDTVQPHGRRACGHSSIIRRVDVPLPIVTGH